jgi:hypothetical protein
VTRSAGIQFLKQFVDLDLTQVRRLRSELAPRTFQCLELDKQFCLLPFRNEVRKHHLDDRYGVVTVESPSIGRSATRPNGTNSATEQESQIPNRFRPYLHDVNECLKVLPPLCLVRAAGRADERLAIEESSRPGMSFVRHFVFALVGISAFKSIRAGFPHPRCRGGLPSLYGEGLKVLLDLWPTRVHMMPRLEKLHQGVILEEVISETRHYVFRGRCVDRIEIW